MKYSIHDIILTGTEPGSIVKTGITPMSKKMKKGMKKLAKLIKKLKSDKT